MEPGKQESKRLNVTVSSGTGTGLMSKEWALCRRVRIIPPSETDSYDMAIFDADDHLIFKVVGQIGTYSDNLEISLGIANSAVFANATSNGTYVLKFDMH